MQLRIDRNVSDQTIFLNFTAKDPTQANTTPPKKQKKRKSFR